MVAVATALLAWRAASLTAAIVATPYGSDVSIVSADSSYVFWDPHDATNGEIAVGAEHEITSLLPEPTDPMFDAVRGLVDSIVTRDSGALANVDALLVWWNANVSRHYTLRQVIEESIPVSQEMRGRLGSLDDLLLCGPQCMLFSYMLRPVGIHARRAGLSSGIHGDTAECGHAVIEVWVDDLCRWIVVDPMMGVRYEIHGAPISAMELVGAAEAGELDRIMVVDGEGAEAFGDHIFAMAFMGCEQMEGSFRMPVYTYLERSPPVGDGARGPSGDPANYYVYWAPGAPPFQPFPHEQSALVKKIVAAASLWVGVAIVAVAGLVVWRRDRTA